MVSRTLTLIRRIEQVTVLIAHLHKIDSIVAFTGLEDGKSKINTNVDMRNFFTKMQMQMQMQTHSHKHV